MTETFSWSRLQTYAQCPAKYAFQYLLGWEPECETLENVLGKLVHETLAAYLSERWDASEAATLAVERFRELYEARLNALPGVRVVKPDTDLEKALGDAEAMVRIGIAQAQRIRVETLAVEKTSEAEIDGVRFTGTIDWLTSSDYGIQIRDWKTSKKTSRQSTVDADGQLALYEILERANSIGGAITLAWHFLRSDTIRTSTRTPDELERLGAELAYRAREITAAQEFPHRPSVLCGWCQFRGKCPASPFSGEDELTGILG